MALIPETTASIRGGTVVIRSARPDEAAKQLAFAREGFRTSTYTLTTLEEFTLTEEQEAALIAEKAACPRSIFINAYHEGEIVGSLAAFGQGKKKIHHQALIGMMMLEAWRGRGVGRALLTATIDWAKANPLIEMLTLGVYAENTPGVNLYTSLGFIEYGRLPRALKHTDGSDHENVDMYLRVKP